MAEHRCAQGALLTGKTCFITGAGQGNGRAIALGVARAGARVVATDLVIENAQRTACDIAEAGGWATGFGLDVTDPVACDDVARRADAACGPIDVLVNNAGILIRGSFDDAAAPARWHKVMDVNVGGTFNVTYALLPSLKKTRGCIVNIASIAAYAGQGASIGYSPSKAAIRLFTQSLAAELAVHGIRVNAIAPGAIETAMSEYTRADPGRLQSFMARVPMGRLGQPEELVGPVLFLASSMGSYVTGATLPVDGGFLAV